MGTVQFGLPYGMVNHHGQIQLQEASAIIEQAWAFGMDTLDTAVAYGESETTLGKIGIDNWQVVTKLPILSQKVMNVSLWVKEALEQSLVRIKKSSVYGLLLHHPMQLLETRGRELYVALQNLKGKGMVQKIGISVYTPEELKILMKHFDFDLVQVPFNIFDRRFSQSGWLSRLKEAKIEVHVRSIFLQGLLVTTLSERPTQFARWNPLWYRWQQWLAETDQTPVQACLGFPLAQSEIDRVIVGIDCMSQLQEIISSAKANYITPPHNLWSDDPDLINPSCWSKR
jgi:hypothetical protein